MRKKQWVTNLELQGMQRRMQEQTHGHVPSDNESEDGQWFLGFDEKVGDVFMEDIRVVVEDIGNQHENAEFGFKIKEDLLEYKKYILKNMLEIRKLQPCS